jgi:hypothetical protein
MLDRSQSARKNSLSDRPDPAGTACVTSQDLELPVRQPVQERLGDRVREGRVVQEGLPDVASQAPAGMAGDDFERFRTGSGLGRSQNDIALDRETVVEERRHDADVRVLAKNDE